MSLLPVDTAVWPRRSLWVSRGSRVLSFWGGLVCVVTNVVNPRCFSCGFLFRCYKRRQSEGFFADNGGFWLGLTTFVTGVLVRRFESCWFDDVCNVGCPLVAWPGPAAVHGHRSQTLSARWPDCLKPSSPLLAGICVGLKPPSPLRVRNRCFWRGFRVQRCRWFQRSLVGNEQWCWWFQRRHVVAPCVRKRSPCVVWWWV